MLSNLKADIQKFADPKRAESNKWFFKTGIGQYGEGDEFAGLTVPQCRLVARKFNKLTLQEISNLLKSKIHEERLIALLILVDEFQKSHDRGKNEIFHFYLRNTKYINNWDLVDLTADKIVGEYLLDKPRDVLYKLAKSKNLWEKRISIIATYQFIKEKKEAHDTFEISEILLNDPHDLIQKATGWMLREVGKRVSEEPLIKFLNKHSHKMPRTMLRYAIEKFPEERRKEFLSLKQIPRDNQK